MKLIALAAAAAATMLFASSAAEASNKVKFRCKGGQELTVTFKDGKARVTVPGAEPVMLPQALAADGFLYAKGKYSLRGKGDMVTWTAGRAKPLTCRAR